MDKSELTYEQVSKAEEYLQANPYLNNESIENLHKNDNLKKLDMYVSFFVYAILILKKANFDTYTSDTISFIESYNEDDIYKKYIGFILACKYSVNLFDIINKLFANNLLKGNIRFFFDGLCMVSSCNYDDLFNAVKNLYYAHEEKTDYPFSDQMKYISFFLKNHKDIQVELLEKYLLNPTKALQTLITIILCDDSNNPNEYDNYFTQLINQNSIESISVAVFYWGKFLNYNDSGIKKFILNIKKFCNYLENENYSDIHFYIILFYMRFIVLSINEEDKYDTLLLQKKVKQLIPTLSENNIISTLMELAKVKIMNVFCEDIIRLIVKQKFNTFYSLDNFFSKMFSKLNTQLIYESLLYIYYNSDDESYLSEKFHMTFEKINNNDAIISLIINKTITGNKDDFTFCVHLLTEGIDKNVFIKNIIELNLNDDLLISLLKGYSLFVLDADKICNLIYEIIDLFSDKSNVQKAIDFYLDFVCEMYPLKSKKICKTYSSENQTTNINLLTNSVKSFIDKWENETTCFNSIPDLMVPYERAIEYHKMNVRFNNEIIQSSEEKSVFAQLFPKKIIKYGKRAAFVQKDKEGNTNLEEAPYMQYEHSIDMPIIAIMDPLLIHYMKLDYINERFN